MIHKTSIKDIRRIIKEIEFNNKMKNNPIYANNNNKDDIKNDEKKEWWET